MKTPREYAVVTGAGDAQHELGAFDAALLAAGVGHLNLVRVSSILPPEARRAPRLPDFEPGRPTLAAYEWYVSDLASLRLSAAVGVVRDRAAYGLIMEWAGPGHDAEQKVRALLDEGRRSRGWRDPVVEGVWAVQHQVERVGCVFAAVILW